MLTFIQFVVKYIATCMLNVCHHAIKRQKCIIYPYSFIYKGQINQTQSERYLATLSPEEIQRVTEARKTLEKQKKDFETVLSKGAQTIISARLVSHLTEAHMKAIYPMALELVIKQ